MQSLTAEQKQELVQIINEEFGVGMALDDSSEALLSLLEDVAGFETASQRTLNQLTQQLWEQYHE